MDTLKVRAQFKVATLRSPRDGEPKVVTYTIDQLVRTVRQAQVSSTTFEAYHFQKSEEKRLTAEARAARAAGDMERANRLKAQADAQAVAVNRTKFGLAIMPFIFKDDITSKVDEDNRPRRDNSRITHFSLLMLDVESKTSKEELHDVLRDYEYVLWPTITHRPEDPRSHSARRPCTRVHIRRWNDAAAIHADARRALAENTVRRGALPEKTDAGRTQAGACRVIDREHPSRARHLHRTRARAGAPSVCRLAAMRF
jgi:hypothetical protein